MPICLPLPVLLSFSLELRAANCIPCVSNGYNAYYVASLSNQFGPFTYWRVLVDTGCTSLLLTLSTPKKLSVHKDDTVLQQLPSAVRGRCSRSSRFG